MIFYELLLLAPIVGVILLVIANFLPKQPSKGAGEYNPDKMFEELMKKSDDIVLHCDVCGKKLKVFSGPHEAAYSKVDGRTVHAEYNVSCECHKYCYRLIYDNDTATIKRTNSI